MANSLCQPCTTLLSDDECRADLKAISLFSGIGGLEMSEPSNLLCEIDEECRVVLAARFPESQVHDDVMTLRPIPAEVVFGGWPCQDLSVAGLRRGLAGEKSGLFFKMVDVAVKSGAHTLIAENVPNLLRLEGGENFRLVLEALQSAGFPFVAWRTLNARQFGLPHQRRRVFIVASQEKKHCTSLFRKVPRLPGTKLKNEPTVRSFYWTAGLQGLNLSSGYTPTLKVGSSLSIPSPPAIFFDNVVRQISPNEAIKLQGFNIRDFRKVSTKAIYRMMGNAVARPVGKFVAESVMNGGDVSDDLKLTPVATQFELFSDRSFDRLYVADWPESGLVLGDEVVEFKQDDPIRLCNSLEDLVDLDDQQELSSRAAAGLVNRLSRSGKPCPPDLRRALERIARA